MGAPDPLDSFHPAVAEWFRRTFPGGPTEAQAAGWAAVAAGEDTLIAAPTGSGKTLAAFLVTIDRCYRAAERGEGRRGTDVVYVSPLRALTVDVAQNLERPLAEIAEVARELGYHVPDVRVAVRNGDTTQSQRAAMLRDRPEIVVTTPESLYLLLTSVRGREMLGSARTVIVDEIHALARDKRGSHLTISLERVDRAVATWRTSHDGAAGSFAGSDHPWPVRIGLSATQRPIATIARLLVGAGPDRSEPGGGPRCTVVDVGHRRPLDVAIELPDDELGAVFTHEQFAAVLERIAAHVRAHRTTLVFVNTRRLAERVAHRLGELVGEELVQAHHGSLSMDRRLRVESRLRSGDLKAVVATASLELGIDVGPVELVCQIGSTRAIATWLQRVGRAQHHVGGTPTGKLYPQTRDELVECCALLAATRRGDLDAIVPAVAPLDILAQQIVAEVAAAGPEGIAEADLLGVVRGAAPYADLSEDDFDSVLELVCEGVQTGRGRRGAHVHRDRVNSVLRPRRGARLTATTSGGAIPELADYRVVLEPEDTFVGTVNEDWAIESMAGDVFLLGSHTWRIRRVESGTVRVVDAQGAPPSVPFWLGEAPARTAELSRAVSDLRLGVERALDESVAAAVRHVQEASGVDPRAAEQVVAYLATGKQELGKLPTVDRFVVERFFDDTGGMQLVLHSPRGARVNRGLGLALRKRFCRSFDFELQAAASDDAVVLSLGPQHSFPLPDVVSYLSPRAVTETLEQAVLPTPIFGSRWRWNLSRSLVSPRYRGSRHLPPAIQRMEADDLMAAIFPMLAACQENVSGPIVIPDHPVVRQTMADCMTESMDLPALTELLDGLSEGRLETHFVDSVGPSILSEEILNGRPYTYLDDAPLEERRSRAVQTRRGGVPLESRDLSRLDPVVVASVGQQARPEPRDPEELHDLLATQVLVDPEREWEVWFGALAAANRAFVVTLPSGERRWAARERRTALEIMLPGARFEPDLALPESLTPQPEPLPEDVVAEAVRAALLVSEPLTTGELALRIAIGIERELEVRSAVARLEGEGSVLQCHVADDPADRYAARHLLMRIHARMRDGARRSIEAVSAQQFMRFLITWQHAGPGNRLIGTGGVAEVIEQLQGFEAPVGAWEESILPARVASYQPGLLDDLCSQGEVGFGRLGLRGTTVAGVAPGPSQRQSPAADQSEPAKRPGMTPSPATPISLFRREDADWLLAALRGDATADEAAFGATADVLEALSSRGALFLTDLCGVTGRMPIEVADALWDGIARGLVTADGFQAVRSLLGGRHRLGNLVSEQVSGSGVGLRSRAGRPVPRPRRSGGPRPRLRPALSGGRWSLLGPQRAGDASEYDLDELAEALAGQLLARWGIVFRDLVQRELMGIGWREVLWALRRLEARGVVLGGRFVGGFTGEQFALPEAYEQLRSLRRSGTDGRQGQDGWEGRPLTISAADPLNLTGVILPGPRVPSLRTNTVTLVDGVVARGPSAGAAGVGAFSPRSSRPRSSAAR